MIELSTTPREVLIRIDIRVIRPLHSIMGVTHNPAYLSIMVLQLMTSLFQYCMEASSIKLVPA